MCIRDRGDSAALAQHESEQRLFEQFRFDDETNRSPTGGHDQQRIDAADVVADQQRSAFFRDILLNAEAFEAIHRMNQQPNDKALQEFWHQTVDVERNKGIAQCRDAEQGRDRNAVPEQGGGGQ